MTPLEQALLKLVAEQQELIQHMRANQLSVAKDGELIVVTFKDTIIYKAKPIQK